MLLRSAFIISFFTILSRLTGFARDVLIASIAGAGIMADAFFAAFKITNFFRKILAEGSFFAAFIPTFSQIIEQKGKMEVEIYSGKILSIMLYILIMITILAEIFMSPITKLTSPGFVSDAQKFNLTLNLSRILFIYFIFIVLTSVLCGVLNGLQKFSYYAIVPILLNLSIISFILIFQNTFKTFSHAVSYGVVFGGFLQFLCAYFGCVYEGIKIKFFLPSKALLTTQICETIKKMLPSIIAGGLTQINTMVDLILGSFVISGVSYLYYCDRIFYLPLSMIGTAMSVAVLPFLSRSLASKDFKNAQKLEEQSFAIVSFFTFPVVAIILICGEMIVSTIFQRGNFSQENSIIVSNMLKIISLGLPFAIYNKVLSSIFFAHNDTKTPMKVTLWSVIANLIASLILIKPLGVYGIISGAVISYLVNYILTTILIKKRKLLLGSAKKYIIEILKVLFSTLLPSILLYYFTLYNHSTSFYEICSTEGFLIKSAYLSISLAIFGTIYCGILYLCGGLQLVNKVIKRSKDK